mmetsp:Transcript_20005/g.50963  ORF Transcript_20005/g.50963 Transcript_20005/m.50963 type:complete len:234 (+) Transcript_20005:227-928(+)
MSLAPDGSARTTIRVDASASPPARPPPRLPPARPPCLADFGFECRALPTRGTEPAPSASTSGAASSAPQPSAGGGASPSASQPLVRPPLRTGSGCESQSCAPGAAPPASLATATPPAGAWLTRRTRPATRPPASPSAVVPSIGSCTGLMDWTEAAAAAAAVATEAAAPRGACVLTGWTNLPAEKASSAPPATFTFERGVPTAPAGLAAKPEAACAGVGAARARGPAPAPPLGE